LSAAYRSSAASFSPPPFHRFFWVITHPERGPLWPDLHPPYPILSSPSFPPPLDSHRFFPPACERHELRLHAAEMSLSSSPSDLCRPSQPFSTTPFPESLRQVNDNVSNPPFRRRIRKTSGILFSLLTPFFYPPPLGQ